MARAFNGTNQYGQSAFDLSSYSLITVAFWMYWDTFSNANDRIAMEYGDGNPNSAFYTFPNFAGGGGQKWLFGSYVNSGGYKFWVDYFTQPSAAAWHHYVLVMNRATPVNGAYVDGVVQTLTVVTHDGVAFGNFGNLTLNLMSRNGGSFFGLGRQSEVAIWGGVQLTQAEATALASGVSPSLIRPLSRVSEWPLDGALSPEPDVAAGKSMTITGATTIAPPGKLGVPAARVAVAA